jgi:peptidoglycan/xylan/chitin deacetylase (PgdA/CDA1 family)
MSKKYFRIKGKQDAMFLILSKKNITTALSAVLAMFFLTLSFSGSGAAAAFNGDAGIRKMPIYNVDTGEKCVALTFDAAFGADKTGAILEVLERNAVVATFFLAGFWVDTHPDAVKKIDALGLEIGTHGETYSHMDRLAFEKQREELSSSGKKIFELVGKSVSVFRPPYNSYNDDLIAACDSLGIKAVEFDIGLGQEGSAFALAARALNEAKNGSIIAFYANSDNIETALPLVILGLQARGFGFKRLSDMLYGDNYYINSAGVQKKC